MEKKSFFSLVWITHRISFFNFCFLRSMFLNCQDKFDDWMKEFSHLSSILREPCRYIDCRWWSRTVELGALTHLAPASCLLESALLAAKIELNCLSTEAVNESHHNLKSSLQLRKFHLWVMAGERSGHHQLFSESNSLTCNNSFLIPQDFSVQRHWHFPSWTIRWRLTN